MSVNKRSDQKVAPIVHAALVPERGSAIPDHTIFDLGLRKPADRVNIWKNERNLPLRGTAARGVKPGSQGSVIYSIT
jgi:hypothetical protein